MTGSRDLFGLSNAPPAAWHLGRRLHLPHVARKLAETMRAEGASLQVIADALGVSVAKVRTRLAAELERGMPGGQSAGRPRWKPTTDDRASVWRMAAEGASQERIAEAMAITPPTLRRHCAAELARGRTERCGDG